MNSGGGAARGLKSPVSHEGVKERSMKPSFRSHVLCVTLGFASIALACAHVSKEPEKASAASQSNAHAPGTEAQTSTPRATAADQTPLQQGMGAGVRQQEERAEDAAAQKRVPSGPAPMRSRPTAGASRREAEAAPKAAPAPYAPAQQAEPTLAETPELLAAIAEFDTEWQQLSATRACEDACRALESMRRSAQRICDLVVASDPNQRCRTAQGRLDQASRDLAARCSACR